MALGANSTLISTANVINIVANDQVDTYTGTDSADAFVIANGDVGDDVITKFSSNDTLITGKKIFDGNNDGYIDFGPNGELDVDRTSSRNAGNDQLTVLGEGNDRVLTIRYLGTKDNAQFAYGAAEVRDQLLGHFSKGFMSTGTHDGDASVADYTYKIDNDVSSVDYSSYFAKGSTVLLTDNADGLNFGGDTITGFGDDDLLVFTSKLYDSDNSGIVTFGGNKVLDLSSQQPSSSDPAGGPGGQLDAGATRATSGVTYLGEKTIGDTTYYYYGTAHSTAHIDGLSA